MEPRNHLLMPAGIGPSCLWTREAAWALHTSGSLGGSPTVFRPF